LIRAQHYTLIQYFIHSELRGAASRHWTRAWPPGKLFLKPAGCLTYRSSNSL
jgi:hypothetical protein